MIGTSGLSDDDLGEIDALAQQRRVGVLAVGNFSLPSLYWRSVRSGPPSISRTGR